MVTISQLAKTGYINTLDLEGRFIPSLSFHDGDWRLWIAAGNQDEMLLEIKGVPAEACYFSRQAEAPTDLFLFFLDFLAQRANYLEMKYAFGGIQDDIFNLSGSLAKLALLEHSHDAIPHGLSRMAAGEVEYFLIVLRSLFDLFQEILMKLWDSVVLLDKDIPKKRLNSSFSKMLTFNGKPADAGIISKRFGLPIQIAAQYESAAPIFTALKKLRDNLVHHGSQLPHIFAGEGQFVIALRDNPFPDIGAWEESERQKNDLVPLLPVLETLLYRSFLACDQLAAAFQQVIKLPTPVVPNMSFFARGYFTGRMVEAIESGRCRANRSPLSRSPGSI